MSEKLSEDCYIYADGVVEEGDLPKVRMQCVECYEKNKLGKLWSGINGYGPWDINCCNCKKIIHKPKGKDEN